MLTITLSGAKRPLYLRSASNSSPFYISFTHSVNKTPVEEHYQIDNNRFIIYKTVFSSYGAGMPDLNSGDIFSIENGLITITNLDVELSEFSVFVGTLASHKLHLSGEEILLSELAPPQSLLKFEIKRVSLFEIMSVNAR